jgi:hypothetical protein
MVMAATVAPNLVWAAPLPPEGGLVRGIYCNPGPAIDNRLWAEYGFGYVLDREERHGGEASLRCTAADATEAQGASQQVTLGQDVARPIVVAGWARLKGVSGPPSYHCSVYVDFRLDNGESWPMKIAAFDPTKEGWQYAEATYTPPAPISVAAVYAFLRELAGTAWFDDVYVGEVLEDGTRGPNLLKSPGFEAGPEGHPPYREEFFAALGEIGCNAFHLYRGVAWDTVMGGDSLPLIEPDDPFLDFVREAQQRGFRVWVTVGLGLPGLTGPDDPRFPLWGCVNGPWGEAYTRAVAYMAQYGIDGVGVVPDEWNYDNSPVESLRKHVDPEVAGFYETLPHWCACDVCRERFRHRYGTDYPEVRDAWRSGDSAWARFTEFRYDSTRDWVDRTVKAAKAVNPKILTDTMICVLPVCSDNRLATGAAWDQIGATTDLDCLQTDPYILLHNYLGDSTHYYPTETTLHLSEANFARRSGVTLEACRLRDFEREKEPVEVYGAALSCWMHGASEFFWWHLNYLLGEADFVPPEAPKSALRSVYRVMEAMEADLAGGEVPGEVLVCYSRRSEDVWDWLAGAGTAKVDPKRGFVAHRNVLYTLLRRGIPFRMTFLEHPDPARLRQAKVLIVPFPYALADDEAQLLRNQAEAGKAVIVLSERSPVDQLGRLLPQPRLGDLINQTVAPGGTAPRQRLRGAITFVDGDLAVNLAEPFPPRDQPTVKVRPPAMRAQEVGLLEGLVRSGLSRDPSLLAQPVTQDVEVALLESPRARVVLAVNWETDQPAEVVLRLPKRTGMATGRRILPGRIVDSLRVPVRDGALPLTLQAQEACLLALKKGD